MRLAPLPPPYYTSNQKKKGRGWLIVLFILLAVALVFLYLKFLKKPGQPIEDDQASIIKNESDISTLEEKEEEIQIPTVEADDKEEENIKENHNQEEEILPSAYLANTDNEVLSKDELSKTEISKIELIRDEIYARHGYIFEDMEKQKYFEEKTWYVKNPNYSPALLNDMELKNLEIISEFLKDEPSAE